MTIIDLFSKRKKKANRSPEPFQTEALPRQWRVQICYLIGESLGEYGYHRGYPYDAPNDSNEAWELLRDSLRREKGVFALTAEGGLNADEECKSYLLTAEPDDALDLVELAFRIVERLMAKLSNAERSSMGIIKSSVEAVAELNVRFVEHSVGYQYLNGEILLLGSEYAHAEIVVPCVQLLRDEGFKTAESEFMQANAYCRDGKDRDAILEAGNALETTIKTVCKNLEWKYNQGDTIGTLVNIIFKENLIPQTLTDEFTSLQTLITNGIGRLRNTSSRSHGQGPEPKALPNYLAPYVIHTVAAHIILIVKAYQSKRSEQND